MTCLMRAEWLLPSTPEPFHDPLIAGVVAPASPYLQCPRNIHRLVSASGCEPGDLKEARVRHMRLQDGDMSSI